ncbi:MAG TPA: replication protein RepA [Fimbriimonadaceae bacterium]|nr:replication protein RepA [Fimbriimonadaceae bacterium]
MKSIREIGFETEPTEEPKQKSSGRVPITDRAQRHAETFGPIAEKEIQPKGYMARELVQCGLPLSKPTETKIVRKNGNLSVIFRSGMNRKGEEIGLPYGSIARFLLVYITTRAIANKHAENPRRIKITSHLYDFLRELDVPIVTGKRGSVRALREQINRLLRCEIAFVREVEDGSGARDSFALMPVTGEYDIWWNYKVPEQDSFFESYIELSETFYEAIIASPVPILLDHLKQLRRSPLAIDFYIWVSYRLFTLNAQKKDVLRLPVPVLKAQLGSSFERSRDFVKHMNEAIEKVRGVFPHLQCELTRNGFTLFKGPTPLADLDKFAQIHGVEGRATKSLRQLEAKRLDMNTLEAGRALAPGWDIRYLESAYWEWVQATQQTPKYVKAHFIKFCKTHAQRNPL